MPTYTKTIGSYIQKGFDDLLIPRVNLKIKISKNKPKYFNLGHNTELAKKFDIRTK